MYYIMYYVMYYMTSSWIHRWCKESTARLRLEVLHDHRETFQRWSTALFWSPHQKEKMQSFWKRTEFCWTVCDGHILWCFCSNLVGATLSAVNDLTVGHHDTRPLTPERSHQFFHLKLKISDLRLSVLVLLFWHQQPKKRHWHETTTAINCQIILQLRNPKTTEQINVIVFVIANASPNSI